VIRSCRREELDEILRLWREARSAIASIPDSRAGIERLFEHAPDSLLVALVDGRIVGAVIAAWDGWRGAVYRLAVLPPHRRSGLALTLVRAGEERLLALGAPRVSALVTRGNEPAEGFWTAAGYERDESVGRFVRNL